MSIAGKAWTNFVREVNPGLLQGKDRGLKGSALYRAGTKPLRYGEKKAAAGVEGAELLLEYEANKAAARRKSDEADEEDKSGRGNDDSDEDAPKLVLLCNDDGNDAQKIASSNADKKDVPDVSKLSVEERDRLKQELSSTRIFTTSDFVKMRKLVERERRAKQDPREVARRKRAIARGEEFEELSDDDSDDDSDEEINIAGAVNPSHLMAEAKRKRQSKAEKLEKIIAGRTQFEQKHREGGSTNVEKKRKKNFQMTKFSRDARSKGRGKESLNKTRSAKQTGHDAKKRRRRV